MVTGLKALDETLQKLLLTRMTTLGTSPGTTQVGFRAPDSSWRPDVGNLSTKKAVNVYLLELRENRRLRTNEVIETHSNGLSFREPAPPRVDCHYLITAWSGAEESAGKTTDEHDILGDALAVLMEARPLNARRVFGTTPFPTNFPPELEDADLPATVVPPEGFAKHPEFWGTLRGDVNPWKPAIHLVVTVPVVVSRQFDGILVTTRITTYRQEGDPGETLIQIGGHVRRTTAPQAPVDGAVVELRRSPAGELVASARTNELGRFTFLGLAAGGYAITARAPGLPPTTTAPFDVPSATGAYDVSV